MSVRPRVSLFQQQPAESPYEIKSVRSEPSQRSVGPATSRPISPASATTVSDRDGENNGNPFESNEEEEL